MVECVWLREFLFLFVTTFSTLFCSGVCEFILSVCDCSLIEDVLSGKVFLYMNEVV